MILEELTSNAETKLASIDRHYSSLQSQLQNTLEDRSRLEREKTDALMHETDSLSRLETQENVLKEEIAALEEILADKNAKYVKLREGKAEVLKEVREKESRFSGLETEIKEIFTVLEKEIEKVEGEKAREEGSKGRIEAEGGRAQANLRKLQVIVDQYDKRLKGNSKAIESLDAVFVKESGLVQGKKNII